MAGVFVGDRSPVVEDLYEVDGVAKTSSLRGHSSLWDKLGEPSWCLRLPGEVKPCVRAALRGVSKTDCSRNTSRSAFKRSWSLLEDQSKLSSSSDWVVVLFSMGVLWTRSDL